MSKRRIRKPGVRTQEARGAGRVPVCLLLAACCLLFSSACRMDMQDQPKLEVYEKSSTTRQFPQGTVARGMLREDRAFYTGKRDGAAGGGGNAAGQSTTNSGGQSQGAGAQSETGNTSGTGAAASNTQANASYPDDVDTFPIPVTPELVARGQERFQIFCSACHGEVGYGDGMIVRRGYRRPQSFHTEQLRGAPVGHFFDVMTNGWGAMPSYAAQVQAHDRWAIVAYIRALQLSQNQQAGTTAPPAPTNPPATARPDESQRGGQR